MKKILKENLLFILIILCMFLILNIKLPYYVSAPGGTINVLERLGDSKTNGSLNMLYVTEYDGTVLSLVIGKIIKSWDISKIENQQLSNETLDDIKLRNKVMLDNSIQNAIFVAYNYMGKDIKITKSNNIVIGVTSENELKIGDKLIKCDGNEINDILDIKKVVKNKNVGDYVNFEVLRDDVLIEANLKVDYNHLLGIAMVTNYEYELSDDIDIKFKNSEGGSSGGLMLSLAIYQEKSGIDIVKGRKIAGTGTIDIDGNVGEIDGIKYKIMGANNDKMDIVLVPDANYEEAKKVVEDNNYKLKLVKINTFEEAIDYLSK